MKIAIFQFKCRQCGAVFGDKKTKPILLSNHLLLIMSGNAYQLIDQDIHMGKWCFHDCNSDDIGIADLVGGIINES